METTPSLTIATTKPPPAFRPLEILIKFGEGDQSTDLGFLPRVSLRISEVAENVINNNQDLRNYLRESIFLNSNFKGTAGPRGQLEFDHAFPAWPGA